MTFGVDVCQCQGNLLWRPVHKQEMMNHTEQTGADMKSALRSGALPAVLAALLDLRAGVATGIRVAAQFSADCAGDRYSMRAMARTLYFCCCKLVNVIRSSG